MTSEQLQQGYLIESKIRDLKKELINTNKAFSKLGENGSHLQVNTGSYDKIFIEIDNETTIKILQLLNSSFTSKINENEREFKKL